MPAPDFSRGPKTDRMAGPLFGGSPAAKGAHVHKARRGIARAFARIRTAEEFLAGDLFPHSDGDQLHMILDSQRLNPGDMLVALCRHLNSPVVHLRISTLTLSAERNLLQLLDLLDSKVVLRLSLLVSDMFAAKQPEMWSKINAAFASRNCLVAASRTHAKVFTLDVQDDRGLVFYGSGNLRTAKSHEQLTLTRDRGVHDFYAAWIDEQIVQHGTATED